MSCTKHVENLPPDSRCPCYAQISLVTDINYQNGQNPCTEYLRKKYPRMKLVSGDVGHDFSYLVHATHLVIGGVSTFSQLAAFLSPSLRHVYLFSWSEVRALTVALTVALTAVLAAVILCSMSLTTLALCASDVACATQPCCPPTHAQKHNNNAVIETVWASMGYFDWPGVIPHHYLVANYTARLSQAIDIMTTFPADNVVAYSCVFCT